MAGQRTMSGLIAHLTGQTPVLPVILTGQFWIRTFYFPYSCRLMLHNAVVISFFFGVFCCFAINHSKKKERHNKLISCHHVVMKCNKVNNKLTCGGVMQHCRLYCTFCFTVISNVTFFGNSMEFGQINRNRPCHGFQHHLDK